MVIGRENADITIEDPEISARHAEVRPAGDRIEIEDLGSTNGTFVNGERISAPYTLSEGDFVRVGQSELELEDDRPAGGTVVAASPSGGTSVSQTPPPSGQDDTIRESAATGTAAGAPPAVESWSPAPTGAGAGAPSQPPAGAYTPPPGTGYGTGQGYQGQQGYGSGYPTGSAGQYGGGPGPGSYGGGSQKKGGKGALIAAIAAVVLLALVAVALFVWPGFLSGNDEEEIRDVVTEFGQSIDDPSVCDLLTPRFLEEITGSSGDDAVEACRTDVEENPGEPTDITINSVEVDGDSATVQAEAEGNSGTFELVKVDDEWLIDNTEGGP